MKSYACYPNSMMRFRKPQARFINPYVSRQTPEAAYASVANKPNANILREEGAYKIQLAVPGLSKEQIKIELNEDQLVITGLVVNQESKEKFIRREFDFAGFKRNFRLHKNADTTALTASFEQGILTITIPDATPEAIKINIQ